MGLLSQLISFVPWSMFGKNAWLIYPIGGLVCAALAPASLYLIG